MSIEQFLAELNIAQKDWGLWLDRKNGQDFHLGQYAFENDRLPKNFIHVDNLNRLAHLRQEYITTHNAEHDNETMLGKIWAENFLRQWRYFHQ